MTVSISSPFTVTRAMTFSTDGALGIAAASIDTNGAARDTPFRSQAGPSLAEITVPCTRVTWRHRYGNATEGARRPSDRVQVRPERSPSPYAFHVPPPELAQDAAEVRWRRSANGASPGGGEVNGAGGRRRWSADEDDTRESSPRRSRPGARSCPTYGAPAWPDAAAGAHVAPRGARRTTQADVVEGDDPPRSCRHSWVRDRAKCGRRD